MATTAGSITLAEYLRTSYRPDVEFIDGELREKGVSTLLHGFAQAILLEWFRAHGEQWGIQVTGDTRTRTGETRVRLPDIVVFSRGGGELGVLTKAPLVAIEVFSPKDTYADMRRRAADLRSMGTENVWLIHPERRTIEVWDGSAWRRETGDVIQAVNSPVHLDMRWFWSKLDKEIEYTKG